MKKWLASTLIFFLAAAFSIQTSAVVSADEIKVYVNAVQIDFPDQNPMINSDSRTLVPVRFVSQALGATVDWEEDAQQVSINYNGEPITLKIGKKEAQVGEKEVTLDTNADIINNRTMVPLRFVSECLGAEVQWNGEKREIYISTAMPEANPFVGEPYVFSDLPTDDGDPIAFSTNPGAQIMYADLNALPIKIGTYTIYNLTVDDENINITQYDEENIPEPIDLFYVQDGKITIGRAPDYMQKGNLFTYSYPIKSTLDIDTPEISEVRGFALIDYENMEFRMLVIENPAYEG